MIKIISWNVNGIRAAIKKGFLDFVEKYNPDILCLQETKAQPEQVELDLPKYPYKYWNWAEKKDILVQQYFQKLNPLILQKDWIFLNMIRRVELLLLSFPTII